MLITVMLPGKVVALAQQNAMEDVGPDHFAHCAQNLNNVTWEDIVS